MPQNQDLEERTEDTANLAGRNLPLKRRGATPTAQTSQENPKGFYNGLKRGAAGLLVGIGLMGLVGCATTGSYAQTQQQKPAQEQYQEIDYENMNLLKSDRTIGGVYMGDGKAVFSTNIGKSTPNLEIFSSDENGNNQERVTFTKEDYEINPILVKDKKTGKERIAFQYGGPNKCEFIIVKKEGVQISKPSYAIMDLDGSNREEINFSLYEALKNKK